MDGNLPRTADELEQKFYQWAEDNGATLDHQLSDVPYTNAVFKLGEKTMVITVMEDKEGYYD